MMQTEIVVSTRGRPLRFPAVDIDGRTIYATGAWPRIARVRDEAWLADDALPDPERAVRDLREHGFPADILTFAQKVPDVGRRFAYPCLPESAAAAPSADYERWWSSLPQETRKNVRRAAKRGVVVAEAEFDEHLLRGIVAINNETPVRQGRPFWHYGKDPDVVRAEYASFRERSRFIAAYRDGSLVGFAKIVLMRDIAAVLQLLCMQRHADSRPANALIAHAVALCGREGRSHLVYGRFVYGRNFASPLTEFKRRNGFEELLVPRYYIPLSARGAVAVKLGMHRALKERLPEPCLALARRVRGTYMDARLALARRTPADPSRATGS
jgi:hypothetical protein